MVCVASKIHLRQVIFEGMAYMSYKQICGHLCLPIPTNYEYHLWAASPLQRPPCLCLHPLLCACTHPLTLSL